jgi:hypothetical protein
MAIDAMNKALIVIGVGALLLLYQTKIRVNLFS